MMRLILGIAERDERIRAVYMNGSRTNPTVPKDIFQDYDIVYVVTETASFIHDQEWIAVFGDLIMLQEPDRLDQGLGRNVDFDRTYAYLMLFTDGNRIDLSLQSLEAMKEKYGEDKLTIPLLDKDNCLPPLPEATDIDYHVSRPTEPAYISCTNDFWWCLQNVAKGIWRNELPYAKQMFEETSKSELNQMIMWWIGMKHDYQISTGKMNKYFKRYLPPSYWELYERTYSGSHYEQLWDSIVTTCDLFRTLAQDVAEYGSFTYPIEDDARMTQYLKHVRELPKDAKEIY